jgi:hypothetical protein
MFTVVFGLKSSENCDGLQVSFLSFKGIFLLGGVIMFMQLMHRIGAEELPARPFPLT